MFPTPKLQAAAQTNERQRVPASALAGRWRNRLGSTMVLEVDDHHRIHGTFHTGAEIGDPRAGYEIVGFAEGDDFAFCVDFGRWGSVASWTGHHVTGEDHGERLVTVWHLAQPVEDPHSEIDTWRAILTGGDEFQRID
ncbi:MAG: avidin/streptavidin family protein [Acidimicrobiia bacterium]|nr:avidin/streptavidin family protein [Acidimicrobiia bacterium]